MNTITLRHYTTKKMVMPTPRFYIYDTDKKKVATLKAAFLRNIAISSETYKRGSFHLNNIRWHIVVDANHKEQIERELAYNPNSEVKCFISFQRHTYGDFAVLRMVKEVKA